MATDLTARRCSACAPGSPALSPSQVAELLAQVPGWDASGDAIARTFTFKNYYQTVAFVNAVAWIAHAEDHHPDIEFGYKTCRIRFQTHSIGGLSENDFICAAKIDALKA